MKIALLTFHNFLDLDIASYFSEFEAELWIFTSKANDNASSLARVSECAKSVRCYDNYMNNGLVAHDILDEHKNEPFTHVLYLGEDDVLRATRVANYLGLPSHCFETALAFRDKFIMKSHLSTCAEITLPAFTAIQSDVALIEFVNQVGFPVFVKPRTSSGSMFAKKIANLAQLRNLLENDLSSRLQDCEYQSDLIAESYIDGDMYHVDGFIGTNGEIECLFPSKYLSSNLQLEEIKHNHTLMSVMLDRENPFYERLIEQTTRALYALPKIENVPIHAEFFVKENGEVIFCEVACRTGGAGVNQAIKHATGYDLNKRYINAQLSFPLPKVEAFPLIGGWGLINPSNHTLPIVPTAQDFDFLSEIQFFYEAGSRVNNKEFSGSKVAKAIATGDTSQEVHEKLTRAYQLFMEKSQAYEEY
ncbi:Hypothetical protein C942_04302 [Photobacterium marinum]|uniref:ATP-grasp domain-containing protein n=1 Tax=Photobacterium marinum TaxID=1056511 RepID=L8JGG4_9GAMM|nr:ATP-grasp domain-containing protein [Photobacterium marinum]ELR66604.1 Hypothetical protein C942_04302 [Photobacterium marinum]